MNNSTKSGLFLIEMIIAIAFFAIAAAVCTNLFVRAHLISENTRQSNMAVLTAQSVVEGFKASDGTAEGVAGVIAPGAQVTASDGSFNLFYDEDWQQTDRENCKFVVDVSIDEGSSPRGIAINVINKAADGSENLIYSLEACKYIP